MSGINELIRIEADGSISFGNYELDTKSKLSDFEYAGDVYKVKTFKEITKLERNGTFVYESVPGTAVSGFRILENGLAFTVEGPEDVQITVEMEEDTEYKILLDEVNVGHMTTNLGGKLSFSVELEKAEQVQVQIMRVE
ncbi:MAG: endosialidase [Lachnospiraceae bacterium]|nr:endosialidase [Lachnospiraceae bacterium]